MKVEQKKRERIKQIAAEKRLAQKFFLIQAMIMMLEEYHHLDDIDNMIEQAMVNAAGVTTMQTKQPPSSQS